MQNKINYATQNKGLRALLSLADFILDLAMSQPPSAVPRSKTLPQRILLVNGAHLGDILLSTACIPVLKNLFPNVEIGMLIGSWSKSLVENHPWVKHVHVVDHWKHNRQPLTGLLKLWHYLKTRRQAQKEIHMLSYDIAIHFNPYFPDLSFFLWQLGIPLRIGSSSAGCRALYTHAIDGFDQNQHITRHFLRLLKVLSPQPLSENILRPLLPDTSVPSREFQSLQTLIRTHSQNHYRVIHVGAGDSHKMWPEIKWKDLINCLSEEDYLIVFTGKGTSENTIIKRLVQNHKQCLNACDLLSLPALIQILRDAELVYSVDSLAAHLAASVGTPCVCLYETPVQATVWGPLGPWVKILFKAEAQAIAVFNAGEELLRSKAEGFKEPSYF